MTKIINIDYRVLLLNELDHKTIKAEHIFKDLGDAKAMFKNYRNVGYDNTALCEFDSGVKKLVIYDPIFKKMPKIVKF